MLSKEELAQIKKRKTQANGKESANTLTDE
jgi:hypothetical protein